jgi:hypothetical protein
MPDTEDFDLHLSISFRSYEALAHFFAMFGRGDWKAHTVREADEHPAPGSYPEAADEGSEGEAGAGLHDPTPAKPKRTRGRPKTKPEPEAGIESDIQDVTVTNLPLGALQQGVAAFDPLDAIGINDIEPLGTLSAKDKLARARVLATNLSNDPNKKDELTKLLKDKYGLDFVKDVPEAKADAFLADLAIIGGSDAG